MINSLIGVLCDCFAAAQCLPALPHWQPPRGYECHESAAGSLRLPASRLMVAQFTCMISACLLVESALLRLPMARAGPRSEALEGWHLGARHREIPTHIQCNAHPVHHDYSLSFSRVIVRSHWRAIVVTRPPRTQSAPSRFLRRPQARTTSRHCFQYARGELRGRQELQRLALSLLAHPPPLRHQLVPPQHRCIAD